MSFAQMQLSISLVVREMKLQISKILFIQMNIRTFSKWKNPLCPDRFIFLATYFLSSLC